MWLPDWLYRTLPMMYSFGIPVLLFSREPVLAHIRTIRITAGLMVSKLGKDYKEIKSVKFRRYNP